MTVTSCANQRWWSPMWSLFDTANAQVEAERNRQTTEVIYVVSDFDNIDPEWKITAVRALATIATATHGNTTLGVEWAHDTASRTSSWQKQTSFGRCVSAFICARIQKQSSPSFVKAWESAVSITSSECIVDRFWTSKQQPRTIDEVGSGSLERLLPGFTGDSTQQATLSAGQSGIWCKRSVELARPAHLGAVIAPRPRITEMIRGATSAEK